MGIGKVKLLLRTLTYIKPIQLVFQVYYKLVPNRKAKKLRSVGAVNIQVLNFDIQIQEVGKLIGEKEFSFLNISHSFNEIDWNYSKFGKLWTYNLNYFDFLLQEEVSKEIGFGLMKDFCQKPSTIKDGMEPYPISLRAINWVKFLNRHGIQDEQILGQLHSDLLLLNERLEYHILANHLFENGFGLLFGAYFFQDEKLYRSAKRIIVSQLKEQILPDGAHYELTPMYHQIILYRILDAYQLVSRNAWKSNELANEFKSAAAKMLGWLQQIQFKNGSIPLVNDTAYHIAPDAEKLYAYASNLEIDSYVLSLKESGYRKFFTENIELLFDAGQIAPSYQPGHSHADNLQILVQKNNRPVLVDTGISTYEKNDRRQLERSTYSHNTVSVNNMNSSEVWSGFRVARRAQTEIVSESGMRIVAVHDGYQYLGIRHQRAIQVLSSSIQVNDEMLGDMNTLALEGHLHFHPDRKVSIDQNLIFVDEVLFIRFVSPAHLKLEDYEFCEGFNRFSTSVKLIYSFKQECNFEILN